MISLPDTFTFPAATLLGDVNTRYWPSKTSSWTSCGTFNPLSTAVDISSSLRVFLPREVVLLIAKFSNVEDPMLRALAGGLWLLLNISELLSKPSVDVVLSLVSDTTQREER
jgi:hypothetical protein